MLKYADVCIDLATVSAAVALLFRYTLTYADVC
jgi:hypothetical protein